MNSNGTTNGHALTDQWDDVSDAPFERSGESFDIWGMVLRRKWSIAVGIVIGLGLGTLYYARSKPVYASAAQMLIQAKLMPLPVEGAEMQYQYFMASMLDHAYVLTSPAIVSEAVKAGKLDMLPSMANVDNAVARIRAGLKAERIEAGSTVFQLSYRGYAADECSEVLNALMEVYEEFLYDSQESLSQEYVDLIITMKEDLRVELEKTERNYRDFQLTSPLFSKDGETTNIPRERQLLIEAERAETIMENSQLQSKIQRIQDALKEGRSREALFMAMGQASDSLTTTLSLEDSSDELLPLLLEEERLSQKFGPDHPKLKSVRRSIEFIRKFREQESEALGGEGDSDQAPRDMLLVYLDSLREQLALGRQWLQQLDADFQAEEEKARQLAAYEAKDADYKRDIKDSENLYNELLAQLKGMRLTNGELGKNAYTVEVLQPAEPGHQVAPNLPRTLFAAIALGTLGGLGLAYGFEKTDKTFRSPAEVGRALRLPLVGHIPVISEDEQPVAGSPLSARLIAAHKPKSPQAEAFRAIRTALYFSNRGQVHKIIQVTSPLMGDGKSTICANLAVTIAQSNKRVLILDGDFRRPTQHKLFGLSMDTGMASVVEGQADPPQAIQSTAVPNLYVMACGPRPHNPSELLTSPEFADLLNLLRDQFDFVLVDTPPLLAVTDPSVVAARVDGVLLTLRLRKKALPSALRARDALAGIGARVVGVVVNGVGDKKNGYTYGGYGYGYSYGIGYTEDREGEPIREGEAVRT